MRKENGYLGILMVSHCNEHPFLLYLEEKTPSLCFVYYNYARKNLPDYKNESKIMKWYFVPPWYHLDTLKYKTEFPDRINNSSW